MRTADMTPKQLRAVDIADRLSMHASRVTHYLDRDLSKERISFSDVYKIEGLADELLDAFRALEEEDAP